jgi:hypothetical protein
MQPFKLQEVRPTDGIFKGSGCGSKYILELNPDKLLPYLIDAGLH